MKTIDLTERERKRSIDERIARLRTRLAGPRPDIVAVLKGILDLLADEL